MSASRERRVRLVKLIALFGQLLARAEQERAAHLRAITMAGRDRDELFTLLDREPSGVALVAGAIVFRRIALLEQRIVTIKLGLAEADQQVMRQKRRLRLVARRLAELDRTLHRAAEAQMLQHLVETHRLVSAQASRKARQPS